MLIGQIVYHRTQHTRAMLAGIGPRSCVVVIEGGGSVRGRRRLWLREHVTTGRPAAGRRRQTHCRHGHEFTAASTRINPRDGSRRCRECERLRNRERYFAKFLRELEAAGTGSSSLIG